MTGGLSKTRRNLTEGIRRLFGGGEESLDSEELLEELEELLISADVGVRLTGEILKELEERIRNEGRIPDASEAVEWLKEVVRRKVDRNHAPLSIDEKPFSVVMVVGVNGVGKTTTIAKLASIFRGYGHRVMLVAGDTFRAGAIEQLSIWGERVGADVVKGRPGTDPAALVYDALSGARSKRCDLILVDTAGRLHTQTNLMDELRKIERVMKKVCPSAPHETFLVLDATTGQNAVSQAELFLRYVDVTGLVLTKLDGTSKGGVVINICDRFDLPIRFIGVGEKVEDLDAFRPDEFVEALFS